MFPYWWEFSRFYNKENGLHVPDEELVRLSLISFEERKATNVHFDIFLDVRKLGWEGVFRMQNEKWKAVLKQVDNKREYEAKGALHNCDYRIQLELWEV